MDARNSGNGPKVAVITGHHPYDVIGFQNMLRLMPGINFYPQNLEDFVTDTACNMPNYDVLVFYCMPVKYPEGLVFINEQRIKQALLKIGQGGRGIVMLHHALFAFPEWDFWSELCGIQDRSVGGISFDSMEVQIADGGHPIARGLGAFEIYDELYLMKNASEDCRVLLKTDHLQSMATIAWTKTYGNSKVFCLQSGHNHSAYANPNFVKIFERGVLWAAGRLA